VNSYKELFAEYVGSREIEVKVEHALEWLRKFDQERKNMERKRKLKGQVPQVKEILECSSYPYNSRIAGDISTGRGFQISRATFQIYPGHKKATFLQLTTEKNRTSAKTQF
jgi:hypothetical protein